jgi:hypothetical protein
VREQAVPEEEDATIVGGMALAQYDVVKPISSGAMGAVYLGRNRETGEEVAIKRLIDTRHAARFEIEARLLASLSHPRVVKVLDNLHDDLGMYIVMELVRGSDLGDVLSERGSPGIAQHEAVDYARNACEALHYVHQQQIVHRDVKPANLILADGGVVLVDFGVARAMEGVEDAGTIAVGTPRFMAPEVFAGGAVSTASDVFGVAATLWTLLVGTPPRYGDTRLEKIAPGLGSELADALAGGLEMLPEERIASAAIFAEALGTPLAADAGESLAISASDRMPARRRVMEAIVRTAAGVFDAAAVSIALTDPGNEELVYEAAWGAGAAEVVGMRLPKGAGLAGSVVASGDGVAVPECRKDTRFAAQVAAATGYVPYTMLVTPLVSDGSTIGVLSVLDRRDGGPYRQEDLGRAALFADLAVVALDLDNFPLRTNPGRLLD